MKPSGTEYVSIVDFKVDAYLKGCCRMRLGLRNERERIARMQMPDVDLGEVERDVTIKKVNCR